MLFSPWNLYCLSLTIYSAFKSIAWAAGGFFSLQMLNWQLQNCSVWFDVHFWSSSHSSPHKNILSNKFLTTTKKTFSTLSALYFPSWWSIAFKSSFWQLCCHDFRPLPSWCTSPLAFLPWCIEASLQQLRIPPRASQRNCRVDQTKLYEAMYSEQFSRPGRI